MQKSGVQDKKGLPSRSTRGNKMKSLLEGEQEDQADEDFWTQDYFRDEEGDVEYQSEADEEDVVDADFDDPENEKIEPLSGDEEKGEKQKKRKGDLCRSKRT